MSIFSVASAVIFFNLSVMLVALLGRNTRFLVKYSIGVLFLMAGLSLIRLVLPLDLTQSFVINSYHFLPQLVAFFNTPILGLFTIFHLCLVFWILGSLVFLLKYIMQSRWEIKRLQHYRPVNHLQAETVLRARNPKAMLTVSPDVNVPEVTGICRPHIYLPVLNLSDEELSWVINHELQHFQNRDLLIKVIYLLLVVIFWWNPLLHIFRRDLDNLLELRCDAALISRASEDGKLFYLHTILKVIRQTCHIDRKPSLYMSALCKCESKSFMHQRFDVMMQTHTCRVFTKIFCVLAVALFFMSYFVIVQTAYEAPDTVAYIEFTPENTYLVYDDSAGKFQVFYNGNLLDTVSPEDLEYKPLSAVPIRTED